MRPPFYFACDDIRILPGCNASDVYADMRERTDRKERSFDYT
jgi:hypothetical protein